MVGLENNSCPNYIYTSFANYWLAPKKLLLIFTIPFGGGHFKGYDFQGRCTAPEMIPISLHVDPQMIPN